MRATTVKALLNPLSSKPGQLPQKCGARGGLRGYSPSGGLRGHTPQKIFLSPSLAPHFSRRVQYFEFRIYCLLKILANEKDVQGINMIFLDYYCTLTYTKCCSSFFVSFGFACKQQLIGNFLIVMVILRLCFPLCYRPVLFISLSFCLLSFIFTAFRV